MQKKLILFLLLIVTMTAYGADPALSFQGSGTEADPWQISTKDDVVELAKACQSGTNGATSGHYDGKFFKLTADIDMSGVTDFYGIGTAPATISSGTAYYFGGNFDGGGFRIKNLKIRAAAFDPATGKVFTATTAGKCRGYIGFFGTLKAAKIKNLIIDKSCDYVGYNNLGGIAGRIEASTTISNCVNEATIHAYNNNIGGIVGYVNHANFNAGTDVVIENCVNRGDIYCAGQYAGGITGNCDRPIMRNCMNVGNIAGGHFDNKAATGPANQTYYGGIAGKMTGMMMTNVLNAGNVSNTGDYCGGLIGMVQSQKNGTDTVGTIEKCVNLGVVMSMSAEVKGAVIGQNGSGTALTMPVKFSGLYYDFQMNGAVGTAVGKGINDGITGIATAGLTGGALPEGLGTEWLAKKGFYPILQSYQDTEAEAAAAAYFLMADNVTTANFSGEATLSTALTGLNFRMAKGEYFKIANGKITITPTKNIVNDTVIISKGDFQTIVPLKHIPTQLFEGKGTETEPYLISTKADLLNLAEAVNGTTMMHFEKTYFKMTADIDLQKDKNFFGIGVHNGQKPEERYYFSGVFDGNGHTIKNFTADFEMYDAAGKPVAATSGAYESLGFFGTLGATGVVKNLTLDETCYITGSQKIGGIAGRMLTGAQIENCHFAGIVKAQAGFVGGIAGFMDSAGDGVFAASIKNCVFSGEVHGDHQYAGGIAGQSKSLISNCVSAGSVRCYRFGAGSATIANHNYVGGITGYNGGEVSDCANYSDVEAYNNVGGLIGMINTYYKGGKTIRCFNSGIVTCTAGQEKSSGSFYGVWTTTADNASFGLSQANYTERQLTILQPFKGGDFSGVHEMSTDSLTSGVAIDSLAQGFSFTKGYYPIPKALADNEAAKKAAAVFFTLQTPQTLTGIQSAGIINNTVELKATLKKGDIFKIEGNRLVPGFSEAVVSDTLTLSAGNFSKSYPISKLPSFLKGEGTKESPWLVETIKDMNKIADFSTVTMEDFQDQYFTLMNDLDYTGETLNPIGIVTPFKGIFDGNGHTVKNIKAESNDTLRLSYLGIFGRTDQGSEVKNIILSNSTLIGTGYTGGIIGFCGGRLENCKTDDKCRIEGKWFASTDRNNGMYIGGLVGQAHRTSSILNCENRATVKGHKYVGGITGQVYNTSGNLTPSMENCVNYGDITATAPKENEKFSDSNAGGISGYLSGNVTNIKNYGTVKTENSNNAGGLAGSLTRGTVLKDSYNYGEVVSANSGAGGLIGFMPATSGDAGITLVGNCGNYGKVSGAMFTGGLVGRATSMAIFSTSFNDGEVSASINHAGGIVGGLNGLKDQSFSVEKCWNTAKVEAPVRVAGIIGFTNQFSKNGVTGCFNTGEISQTVRTDSVNSCAAGIANGTVAISNSYNTGKVSGWNYVGGITGKIETTSDTLIRVVRSYNLGEITTFNEGNGTRIGNISGTRDAQVVRCYSINTFKTYSNDQTESVDMCTPFAMTEANLGNTAYKYTPLCFPMVAGLDTVAAAKANAAYFKAPAPNDKGNIDYFIELSKLAGVTWTSNNLLKIDGDKAEPLNSGEAALTATCGKFSKTWLIKVDKLNSVSEIEMEEVIETEYYSPVGYRLAEPLNGMNIVVYTTASGKKITRKIMVRK